MVYDLHTHSTFSDGTTSPAENAAFAAAVGLVGFALTDHDTMDGWAEAAQACQEHGLDFVPGVELSTEFEERGIHLLGYWVDPTHPALVTECVRLRAERDRRANAMVANLAALGIDISIDDVRAQAAGAPLGRPHLAAVMIAKGFVTDEDAAFDQYLADGGPAYEPKRALAPVDGVALIRAAGGTAVLAHPGLGSRDAPLSTVLLDQLRDAGMKGVEADHCGHDPAARNYWRAAARRRGMSVTGSSDFHGSRKESKIGDATTSVSVVEELRRRAATAVDGKG
ncbi:MAG: PHP domain-containing protein [Actinomycetota bacterium]|nr:PHP domain-containing protein [Euzebyaceae bacterium]MDQ3451721.1 PHP domain-containing protein [Actinomycetota bacterium]